MRMSPCYTRSPQGRARVSKRFMDSPRRTSSSSGMSGSNGRWTAFARRLAPGTSTPSPGTAQSRADMASKPARRRTCLHASGSGTRTGTIQYACSSASRVGRQTPGPRASKSALPGAVRRVTGASPSESRRSSSPSSAAHGRSRSDAVPGSRVPCQAVYPVLAVRADRVQDRRQRAVDARVAGTLQRSCEQDAPQERRRRLHGLTGALPVHPLAGFRVADMRDRSAQRGRRLHGAEGEEREVGVRMAGPARTTISLGTVLDDDDAVRTGERDGWPDVESRPERMREDNRARLRPDDALEIVRPPGAGLGVDVDGYDPQAVPPRDRRHVGHRQRREHDLVAGRPPSDTQIEVEGRTHVEARQGPLPGRPQALHAFRRLLPRRRRKAAAQGETPVAPREVELLARPHGPGASRCEDRSIMPRRRGPHAEPGATQPCNASLRRTAFS